MEARQKLLSGTTLNNQHFHSLRFDDRLHQIKSKSSSNHTTPLNTPYLNVNGTHLASIVRIDFNHTAAHRGNSWMTISCTYQCFKFTGLQLPRRGVLSPILYADVPARTWKLDSLDTNFLHNYPPISIPFWKKSTQFAQIGCFYHNLLKIHPSYVIWAPSFLMKNHQSLYQIL